MEAHLRVLAEYPPKASGLLVPILIRDDAAVRIIKEAKSRGLIITEGEPVGGNRSFVDPSGTRYLYLSGPATVVGQKLVDLIEQSLDSPPDSAH